MNRHQIDEALALDASEQLQRPHRGATELLFSARAARPHASQPRRHRDGADDRHERHRPNSHPEMRHARA